ncbi:MAG: pyruvate ferredoxin oxidoreductase alpha subunit [Clostridia bacterium]|nr:pyruvate ferredoxin oxidoreductase alpha subunit [Clostridia bacterium]
MRKKIGLTGDGAAAEAMRQIDPEVVAVYPITPQTEIVERFAEFVAEGLVQTELINVESEHSALSACCGSSMAGVRTMTCTSAQGLALMHEMLYIAAGNRLPIVMVNVNRTLSAPINIHNDQSDSLGSRDAGWIQLYCENPQEVYDTVIQAVRIAEDHQVMLPVMVCLDGFIVSHNMEPVELLDDGEVKEFIGEFKPRLNLLDTERPITAGNLTLPEYFFEHKYAQVYALEQSKEKIEEVGREFGDRFGRRYGLVEGYKLDDAEIAVITLGSMAGTARVAVDALRGEGIKAGLLKMRCYRPFPVQELAGALKNIRAAAVMEKAVSPGAPGPAVFSDIIAALYRQSVRINLISYVAGLGGRDVPVKSIHRVYEHLQKVAASGEPDRILNYLDLRGWE